MATEDCSEIGRGECPCGKGVITVERCTPDHPWASAGQASYHAYLVCKACEKDYVLYQEGNEPPRLVKRTDFVSKEEAKSEWHQTLREIESSQQFRSAKQFLDQKIALSKSKAAAFRMLQDFGVMDDSLYQFRKRGFTLSVHRVLEALKAANISSPEIVRLHAKANALWAQGSPRPPGIKTGISGLEM